MMTRQPTLFVGHGSPMNALLQNSYTQALGNLGKRLPQPTAILAVSAHWETEGTRLLQNEKPKTIHDFYGFPKELHEVQYPAAGAPQVASRAKELLAPFAPQLDDSWGLDHGTWSVLLHMYPNANIPVTQLSLNRNLSFQEHLKQASLLRPLRDEGVLIVGSGNITHNLRAINWDMEAAPFDWAVEFDEMMKEALINRDLNKILPNSREHHALWGKVLPTLEHYLPLLYALGASEENEVPSFPYEGIQLGSLSMRSVMFGKI